MEKIISFDKQGRLYIPEEMRKYLQVRTLLVRILNNMVVLEPIDEDPIEALGSLGRKKLKGKSIKQLKKDARKEIEDGTIKKIRR